jgi:hypothetical protein
MDRPQVMADPSYEAGIDALAFAASISESSCVGLVPAFTCSRGRWNRSSWALAHPGIRVVDPTKPAD